MKITLIALLIFTTMITGCGGNGNYDPSKNKLYTIDLSASKNVGSDGVGLAIKITDFGISQEFDTRNLVILKDQNNYVKDYYQQFVIDPAIMIKQQSGQYLNAKAEMGTILPEQSVIEPDYIIEAEISRLFGDFTDIDSPTAVMQIHFYVIKFANRQTELSFEKVYTANVKIKDNSAASLIEGYETALVQILDRFSSDFINNVK